MEGKITLSTAALGDMTIRDQRPPKYIKACMNNGASPQDYLYGLNGPYFPGPTCRGLPAYSNRHSRYSAARRHDASS
jgi:hypothetical protein